MSDDKVGGYGRYKDDPTHVGCPRARSDMTPCVARDGRLAIDDPHARKPVCVGCGSGPRDLLLEFSEAYVPACRYRQTHDPRNAADTLTQLVREATEPHNCATCESCAHAGNKCCGCHDGACCEEATEAVR